uniref:SUI1 domain-containing protein n=1 Tax=Lygus hesperus TaxID=30085 RepID=A0A0K8T9F8_LYGHE
MFKKPFKTKSNCQLKTSEKKKLLSRIKLCLPQFNEESELFNIKDPMNTVKVSLHSGVTVNIFVHGSTPVFFEFQDVIYPTIFILWKFPHLVYSFVTHDAVLGKLYNGADLMLPGVIFSSDFSGDISMINKGRPAAVCTDKNLASVAVGQSMLSGQDIASGVKVGRAVKILHTFGDELQKLLDEVPKLPIIIHSNKQIPDVLGSGDARSILSSFESSETSFLNHQTSLESNLCSDVDNLTLRSGSHDKETEPDGSGVSMIQIPYVTTDEVLLQKKFPCETSTVEDNNDNITPEINMDELAEYCLLKSLLSKKLECPILANLFYSKFMLSFVPEGLELNIKKTKHKKLSNMLKEMMVQGVLVIEDIKGVQSITSVNPTHTIFKEMRHKYEAFEVLKTSSSGTPEETSSLEKLEEIKESLVINKLVSPLFKNTPFQKGDVLPVTKPREIIVTYVKETGLTQPSSQNVVLDPILSDIISTRQTVLPWADLINKIIDKMATCYTIRTSKDRIISGKGKLPLIEISTATRSGNKSVTIVNNLEKYGINLNEFARHCQHALAASTTTHPTPSGTQFQVQGSHKPFICALLVERYNIPQRVIPGFAEKSKGKKGRK